MCLAGKHLQAQRMFQQLGELAMYKETIATGLNPNEINMLMSLTPTPPTTLNEMVAMGIAWDVDPEKDRYSLRYLCPTTQREQKVVYRREELSAVDNRLLPVLHVLGADWPGKSVQIGLVRSVAYWATERQQLTHRDTVYHWETWEALALEQSSVTISLALRTYELLDHAISGLSIVNPTPGHPKIRINSGDFEQQYPGILGAIETAHLGELAPHEAAQYCLATLGYPNSSYPGKVEKQSLPTLPEDLVI